MALIEIKEDEVIVRTADLKNLTNEVVRMREAMENLVVNAKIDALCNGPLVTGSAARKIMGWSPATFNRRLHDEDNPIQMTKDGRGYVMPRAEFIEYYNNFFNPKN